MIKSYFLVAFRNLIKNKFFSFVNIFGLSLSLSVCLLVIIMIHDQNSFDLFHPKSDDVYRLNTIAIRKTGGTEPYASSPYLLGPTLQSENRSVVDVVRLVKGLSGQLSSQGEKIALSGYFTESSFFNVFGFELAVGDPTRALQDPSGIILSDEFSRKVFGSESAYGRSIIIENIGTFQVMGILKPTPGKTHLEFDALGSVLALPALEKNRDKRESITDRWTNHYRTYTYVLLQPGSSIENISQNLDEIPKQVYGNLELESRDAGYRFEAQALSAITPGPHFSQSIGRGLPLVLLIFLSVLTGIGMFAAIFNYVNLTLSRSLTRAREIGIRKVNGATRRQIFFQFIGESIVISMMAFVMSELILRSILIPGFESLKFTRELDLSLNIPPTLYFYFFLFVLLTGFLAGCIPAGVLSSFKTMAILKDASKIKVFSRMTYRKLILFFQFGFTFVLLIVLTMIYKQTEYSMKLDYYGFSWDRVINVTLQGQSPEIVAAEMSSHPDVANYSFASHLMGTWEDSDVDIQTNLDKEAFQIRDYSVDERFLSNMKVDLISGKNFENGSGIKDEIIVNQMFLERFDIPKDQALGKTVYIDKKRPVVIIGVTKDFVFKPLTYSLEPLVLQYNPSQWSILQIRLHGENFDPAIKCFEAKWKSLEPTKPMKFQIYSFTLQDTYAEIRDMTRIIGFLAALVFSISILGLLGIATYTTETRAKEIGLRKIMGAKHGTLVVLLSKQYFAIVFAAAILFVPLSFLLVDALLSFFAFHIDSGVGLVLPAVITIFSMIVLTVGLQAYRAAIRNPVESLRYE